MSKSLRLGLLVAFMGLPGFAVGHGGPEIPLYVAEDGLDSGNCENPQAPCATIAYALGKAGKGTEIRVAEGSYDVETTEDLFHLLSDVVSVTGGYRTPDSTVPGEDAVSTLTGVPAAYREQLRERGFRVIADRKGIEGPESASTARLLALHQTMQASLPLTPCVNGDAAGLPCDSVDLVAHVPFADVSSIVAASNDVWGFIDLNTHREYVIIGFNNGTAVFDVSDPENPAEIGFIVGQNTTWRDIKVYQFHDRNTGRWNAYAYVTTDGAADGMIVIDLTGLPHFIVKRSYLSDFAAAHNVYLSDADYSTGVTLTGNVPTIIVAGSDNGNGRYRAYSLGDPLLPAFVGDAPVLTDSYMHDAASLLITDQRKDQQCVDGTLPWCNVLLDFNENTIDVWDITDPTNASRLSSTPYTNARYVHSGWWSEDRQYMFVHDELDEQSFALPTTLRVFSLADLNNPTQVGEWTGPTNAIDHNGFVRGNRYYMSNYSRGLTVLDITDPTNPQAVGRLDTYPFSDGSTFVGAWGAYPFLPSGNIAISDINSGLYLAADRSRDVAEGQLAFSARSYGTVEGAQAQIAVQRVGGAAGAVSVDWEVLALTATADDVDILGGTLNWADGDATDRNIVLTTVDDGVSETMESFMVRLSNPAGGATLGDDNISFLYTSDAGSTTEVTFDSSLLQLAENDGVTAVLTVRRVGNATGAVSVDYGLTASDAVAGVNYQGNTSGTLNWADGDARPQSLEFTILDDSQNNPSSFIELSLSNPTGAALGVESSARLVIEDGAGSNLPPVANAGSSQTVDESTQVTLDGSQSNDPDGTTLDYEWTQLSGVAVNLNDARASVASFTAPSVSSDAMLQFQLTVFDPRGASSNSTTTITVINTDPGNPGGGGSRGGGGGALTWLFLVALTWFRLYQICAITQRGGV